MNAATLGKDDAPEKNGGNTLSQWVMNACLILAGIFIFSLSHPGIFSSRGFSFLGFIALVPVFLVVKRTSFKTVWLWGFAYGSLSYAWYCFWLVKYEIYVYFISCAVYGMLLALVFEAMHFCFAYGDKWGTLAGVLVWCLYEYAKTLGFLGFSYGIIGYTQWQNTIMIQCASFGGVWIVSFICVSCSAVVADCIECAAVERRHMLNEQSMTPAKKFGTIVSTVMKKQRLPLSAVLVLLAASSVYGVVQCARKAPAEQIEILCVQNNTDPWKGGVSAYREDIHSLKTLTDIALKQHPETKFVVWPETAVVPPIVYNYSTQGDIERFKLIKELLLYLNEKDCVFVIGNEQSEISHTKFTDDYNAVLVFDRNKNNIMPPVPDVYRKMHLVPFTEYFPYGKLFPHLYKKLLNGDTHLWTAGKDASVFTNRNISFATPVCFEDTFGSVCRKFVNKRTGAKAQLFINVSNDAWSGSVACQYQHLSMAVFRCVENSIPEVRSTASGVTCVIDKCGRVVEEAPQFTEAVVCRSVEIPLQKRQKTVYTLLGDFIPFVELLVLLSIGIGETVSKVVERKRQNEVK